MIQDPTLQAAIQEAERFIQRAKTLQEKRAGSQNRYWEHSIHASACRRASMDLTRTLADLRASR